MSKTIGVAIPCYKPHHSYLYRLFDSIIAQTHKPDRVVVSCSSWDTNTSREHMYHGIPITVIYSRRRIVQAENRNIAASLLGTDLITFIDADDLMHPRRLEFIVEGFARSNCECIVHDYQYIKQGDSVSYASEDEPRLTDDVFIKNPRQHGCIIHPVEKPFHHAHVTVSRDVYAKLQFPTQEQYYRIEDSVYLATLLAHGIRIRYLENKLSQYMY